MNGFMIFITGGIGIFIGAFILSIKILFELSEENKRNRERIDYLVVKYEEIDKLKAHCDWLEQRVKWHRVELDKLQENKGSDDETTF